ncbi:MAG: hypothetical protein HQL65_03595 [Magnetococcales bacterium]|nr:hypothetical protein [Magnetococcales bacterium]
MSIRDDENNPMNPWAANKLWDGMRQIHTQNEPFGQGVATWRLHMGLGNILGKSQLPPPDYVLSRLTDNPAQLAARRQDQKYAQQMKNWDQVAQIDQEFANIAPFNKQYGPMIDQFKKLYQEPTVQNTQSLSTTTTHPSAFSGTDPVPTDNPFDRKPLPAKKPKYVVDITPKPSQSLAEMGAGLVGEQHADDSGYSSIQQGEWGDPSARKSARGYGIDDCVRIPGMHDPSVAHTSWSIPRNGLFTDQIMKRAQAARFNQYAALDGAYGQSEPETISDATPDPGSNDYLHDNAGPQYQTNQKTDDQEKRTFVFNYALKPNGLYPKLPWKIFQSELPALYALTVGTTDRKQPEAIELHPALKAIPSKDIQYHDLFHDVVDPETRKQVDDLGYEVVPPGYEGPLANNQITLPQYEALLREEGTKHNWGALDAVQMKAENMYRSAKKTVNTVQKKAEDIYQTVNDQFEMDVEKKDRMKKAWEENRKIDYDNLGYHPDGAQDTHLRNAKDAWIRGHKNTINITARRYGIPPEVLAGIAFSEVGGDPDWIDNVAYPVRKVVHGFLEPETIKNFPDWMDKIKKTPLETSAGDVSIQIRRVAEVEGLDAYDPKIQAEILDRLQKSKAYNLDVSARHVRDFFVKMYPDHQGGDWNEEQVKRMGYYYNKGPHDTIKNPKKTAADLDTEFIGGGKTSYGRDLWRKIPYMKKLLDPGLLRE